MATKKNTKATKKNTKATTKASTKKVGTKRSKKRENPNPDYRAVLSVFGAVQSVYEGDNALYLTVKVWNDSEYYSSINISVDYDLAYEKEINEGDTIAVKALCSTFFEKKSQRVVPIFTAFEIMTDEEDDEEDEED